MIDKTLIKKTATTVAGMLIASIVIYQLKKNTRGILGD
jgi:hypothetical protein